MLVENNQGIQGTGASFGHSLLGLISALMPIEGACFMGIGFILYEMNRVKTDGQRIQSFEEFVLGFLAGKVINES
jgi:hypothetical protein